MLTFFFIHDRISLTLGEFFIIIGKRRFKIFLDNLDFPDFSNKVYPDFSRNFPDFEYFIKSTSGS